MCKKDQFVMWNVEWVSDLRVYDKNEWKTILNFSCIYIGRWREKDNEKNEYEEGICNRLTGIWLTLW